MTDTPPPGPNCWGEPDCWVELPDCWVELVEAPIATDRLVGWATTPDCGAVVSFLGVVRDHAEGRQGVHAMTYEAYREPALRRLREVAEAARYRWPDVSRIALVHALGELPVSEASVAVVVSSPHRTDAFDAARFCIDTLKETVPIWKKEHWTGDGAGGNSGGSSDWALGAHEIRPVVDDDRSRTG
jgi:molybdopterin synthase catalytic subunit